MGLLLLLLLGLLLTPISSGVNLCYCIGDTPTYSEVAGFNVIVVDLYETPMEFIREAVDDGKIVLAYINLGFAEDWRPYWDRLVERGIVHGESDEYEGEYFIEYWSSEWREVLKDMIELAVEKGFTGVYLDNIDVITSISEEGFHWAKGVELDKKMVELVNWVSSQIGNGIVMVNIGVASNLLYDNVFLESVDGVLREEMITVLKDKCESIFRPLSGWIEGLNDLTALIYAHSHGLSVSIVEFVDSYWEAMVLKIFWEEILGMDLIAQPSCDPYYEGPPMV